MENTLHTCQMLVELTEDTGIFVDKLVDESTELPQCHVLITSVKLFCKFFCSEDGPIVELVNPIKRFVYDEADFIFTDDKDIDSAEFFENLFLLKKGNNPKYSFFCTTLRGDLLNKIRKVVGETDVIRMPNDQKMLRTIQQVYRRCENKMNSLSDYIDMSFKTERILVYVNTVNDAYYLSDTLRKKGFVTCVLVGVRMTAEFRENVIYNFNKGNIQVIISNNTIDRDFFDMITMVVNYDLPEKLVDTVTVVDEETYLQVRKNKCSDKRKIGLKSC